MKTLILSVVAATGMFLAGCSSCGSACSCKDCPKDGACKEKSCGCAKAGCSESKCDMAAK